MKNKIVPQKLLRNIVIIIIIITTLIIVQQKTYNDYISNSISKSHLSVIGFKAEELLKGFYKPIESNLNLLQKYGQSGLLSMQNPEDMNSIFIPILEEVPQIHSVKIASEDKQVYTLSRADSQWVTGVNKNPKKPDHFFHQFWSSDGELIRQEWTETKYDAFQRPWYLAARDSSKTDLVWWTKPRLIDSAKSQGITASVKWMDKKRNNHLYVLAFDVLLKDIYQSISNLQVSENSRVFLYRGDEKVFKLTTPDTLVNMDNDSGKYFVHYSQLKTPYIEKAINHWKDLGMPVDEPIDFSFNRTSFWVGFRSIDREHSILMIGIIVPENDILHQLQRRQMTNASISVSILLVGILITIIMIRKYRKQLISVQLTTLEGSDLETKIRELIDKGEGEKIEFKSTMRMNLKTNQPGKEIEIAWLKAANAFMNSEGGILLFGVNDAGEFVGLETDNFENEDKCRLHFKNLINQHIGAEFTSYLNFRVLKIENKTIAFLECTPSQKPVFLKDKNEEYFFIRSGPSSIKLQTSKVLDYIGDRKP